MGMSEKEWGALAQQQNLDPATGKRITREEEPPAWEPHDVAHVKRELTHINDYLRAIQVILAVGFVVLVTVIIILGGK
jgi:hypothetical protein